MLRPDNLHPEFQGRSGNWKQPGFEPDLMPGAGVYYLPPVALLERPRAGAESADVSPERGDSSLCGVRPAHRSPLAGRSVLIS